MFKIKKLAYAGAEAKDLSAWSKFATDVMGLEVGRDSGSKLLHLRADERHHRLSIHEGDQDDVTYIGWEVGSQKELQECAAILEKNNIEVHQGTANEIADRRILEMIWFICPFTGTRMEISIGSEVLYQPIFRPSGVVSGFKTGSLGLGHFVFYVKDVVATADFYMNKLGFFGLSDWVVTPERKRAAAFLHCNPRHHSMAFIQVPHIFRRVQHIFFEVNTIDDLGRAYDVALENKLAATAIGRHPNDKSISFYFYNPSEWFIEYGWDLAVIDPLNNTPEQYALSADMAWGHQGLRNLEDRAIAKIMNKNSK